MLKFITHIINFIRDTCSSTPFTSAEHANNINTTIDKVIDAFMAAWNFFDNNYMSFYKNVTRFVEVPQGEGLALFIPLLLTGSIIYFFVEVWYNYLHRDAWDAYWSREAEKLRHINALLNTLNPKDISPEQTAVLNKIAANLEGYENDTKHRYVDKNDLNGKAALDEVKDDLKLLKQTLTTDYHIDLNKVNAIDISPVIPIATSPRKPLTTSSDSDDSGEGSDIEESIALEAPPPKTLKNDLLSFTNSSGFTTVFAFAWGYWFVYYFAIFGVPAAVALAVVPPLFALIALVCPITYLIYKEYKAYQAAVLVKETLTEEEKAQLKNDTRQFRYGWGFVVFIAGLAIFMFLQPVIGLSLAVLTGAGVIAGVGLFLKGITRFLDKRAEFRREEYLANENSQSAQLPGNDTRRAWAMARKRQLKSAEQAAYQLIELSELEAALRVFNTHKNDGDKSSSKATIEEEIKLLTQDQVLKIEAEKKRTRQIRLAYAHMVLGIILDIFMGYMLACLIGFALGDFLSPISNLLGFVGPLLNQVFFNVTVGGLGLLCAGSKAYLTYQDQSKKIADLENTLSREDVYREKQLEILALVKLSDDKREQLNRDLNALISSYPSHQASLHALQKLLTKPEKPRTFTLRKFVKELRKVISAVTSISSVILIARAVATMGILGGAFNSLLNGSLIIFGTAVMSSNPLGIAILSIATALIVGRLIRELYLQIKTERDLKKMKALDLKYDRKMYEWQRLKVAENGIKKLEQGLINQPARVANEGDTSYFDQDQVLSKEDQRHYQNNHPNSDHISLLKAAGN